MIPLKSPSFPYRPLFYAAVGFCLGLVISRYIVGGMALIFAFSLIFLGMGLKLIKLRCAPIMIIMCALGMLRLQFAYPTLPAPVEDVFIQGRICEMPVRSSTGWNITLDNVCYGGRALDGKLALNVFDPSSLHEPEYAQFVMANASISLPLSARNEGGMDMRFYYFSKGIIAQARCGDEEVLLFSGDIDLYGRLLELKQTTTSILISLIGRESGSLAACMLHGDSSEIPSDALEDFRASGSAHLLAVSGLHVSIIVGILLLLIKKASPLAQLIIIAVFLFFYCAFTAFSPSTLRASTMTLCLLLGRALSRPNDPLTSLSFSFLTLSAISPFSVFTIGFQLSFCAVLGILLLYPVLSKAFSALPDTISGALGVSLAAQVATFPATAAYFSRFPIFSVLVNMLIVPLAPLVILPSGIALIIYPVSSKLAGIIAAIADNTLILMRAVTSLVADMGAFYAPAPSFFTCVLFFICLLFISRNHLSPYKTKLTLSSCAAALCFLTWLAPSFTKPAVYVDVLDMYSGYAAYLHTEKESLVIGSENALASSALTSYLRSCGIRSYTVSQTQNNGAIITLGNEEIALYGGYVELHGIRYSTSVNGRIRIQPGKDGGLIMSRYAKDDIYDILIE